MVAAGGGAIELSDLLSMMVRKVKGELSVAELGEAFRVTGRTVAGVELEAALRSVEQPSAAARAAFTGMINAANAEGSGAASLTELFSVMAKKLKGAGSKKEVFGAFTCIDCAITTRELNLALQSLGQFVKLTVLQDLVSDCEANGKDALGFPEYLTFMLRREVGMDTVLAEALR